MMKPTTMAMAETDGRQQKKRFRHDGDHWLLFCKNIKLALQDTQQAKETLDVPLAAPVAAGYREL